MKSLITGLALAVLLVGSGAQAGIKKGQFEFTPILGMSVPLGEFGDVNDAGIGFGARGAYFISSRASVGISIVQNTMDFNSLFDALALADTIFPGAKFDFSITEVSADFRYHFLTESAFSPYINGSVGMFMNKLSASAPGFPDINGSVGGTMNRLSGSGSASTVQDSTTIQEVTVSQSKFGFGGSVGIVFRGQGSDAGFLEARIIRDSYNFEGARLSSTKYLSFRGGITFFFGGTD